MIPMIRLSVLPKIWEMSYFICYITKCGARYTLGTQQIIWSWFGDSGLYPLPDINTDTFPNAQYISKQKLYYDLYLLFFFLTFSCSTPFCCLRVIGEWKKYNFPSY